MIPTSYGEISYVRDVTCVRACPFDIAAVRTPPTPVLGRPALSLPREKNNQDSFLTLTNSPNEQTISLDMLSHLQSTHSDHDS